jgi:PilZ domain
MADNRRKESRNLCASLATLFWQGTDGLERECEANVLDVSARGLGVQADDWIESGIRIRVEWRGHCFTGKVRHTHESEIGPVIGVELDEDCRWSELILSPEYMVKPDGD